MTVRPTDRELADWFITTCRLYGASEAVTLKCASLFIEGLHEHWRINDAERARIAAAEGETKHGG